MNSAMPEAAVEPSSKPIQIKLPDGNVKTLSTGATGADLATSISTSLAKVVVAMEVDGEVWDLDRELPDGATVRLIRRQDDDALPLIRHDAAHAMAEAVQELYPGTQVTIGPSIDDGFYYDFARNEPFTPDDLEAIEARMAEVVDRAEPIQREVWDRNDAIALFEKMGEQYKVEIIQDLPEGETITLYRQGGFVDLCRGPHMRSTKDLGKAFKLMKVAGAYWRGDSNNAQLQR
ncbi:MAG: TGS domain-containing protein, partial [Geminicoccaceae bacterium]